MLATQAQVKQAMELSSADIRAALGNSGYTVERNEIIDAEFRGFNGNSFVYSISYPNPEDEGTATGYIYVTLKRRALSSKFEFYAEY